jgi:hypothetical protein
MKKYSFWIALTVIIVAIGIWYWWKKPATGEIQQESKDSKTNTNTGGGGSYQAPTAISMSLANWTIYKDVELIKGSTQKEAVKLVQMVINKLFPGKYNLVEDGIFGNGTESAVKSIYQSLSPSYQNITWILPMMQGKVSLQLLDNIYFGKVKKLFIA